MTSYSFLLVVVCLQVWAATSSLRPIKSTVNTKHSSSLQTVEKEEEDPLLQVKPDSRNNGFHSVVGDFLDRHEEARSSLVRTLMMAKPPHRFSFRRNLEIGDFDELNTVFENAVIQLPDSQVSTRVLGFTLSLDLRNILCSGISIGDILISYTRASAQQLSLDLQVLQLDLTCTLDYDYRYTVTRGSGQADAYTDNNDASVSLVFSSPNFDTQPPSDLTVQGCNANINVVDLDFRGGVIATVLNAAERLVRGTVETEVRNTVCSELNSLGDTLGMELIQLARDTLNPYLEPLAANYSDPLYLERTMQVPPSTNLLEINNTEGVIGGWFNSALQEIDALLGSQVDDPNSPTGTGRDLGINRFLRDTLLDQDRAFTLTAQNLSTFLDGPFFSGHDQLTETNITLDTLRVFGLDTFSKFDPLIDIGQYTLQNELSWADLTFEVDLNITIRPSTLPDSIIVTPGAEIVREKTRVRFGVENVDAVVTVLLAVDQDILGGLTMGPLLNTDNLISCLASTLFKFAFTGLDVGIGNIRDPILDGFISPGIDRVVSTAVEAMFVMYKPVLLQAMPNIFQTTLRDIANENIIESFLNDTANTDCPEVTFGNSPMDFRDLFLAPGASAALGGAGNEPYGNLGSMIHAIVTDQLTVPDESGMPTINSFLIAPLTESQSGEVGMLRFEQYVVDLNEPNVTNAYLKSFVDQFRFAVFDTRFSNIDTLTLPLSLMEPANQPHILPNLVSVGPVVNRTLTAKVRFLLYLEGEGSPLNMRNEFDIVVKIPSAIVNADLLAKIDGQSFSRYPLEDLLDLDCWLSILPALELSNDGFLVDESLQSSLGLSRFVLSLIALSFEVDCLSCSSPGTALLPEITTMLEETGVFNFLRQRIETFTEEVLTGDWLRTSVERRLATAPNGCPHNDMYNSSIGESSYVDYDVPSLSRSTVEAVVLLGAVVVEAGVVVFAEGHNLVIGEPTDPLSRQMTTNANGRDYLDWTDLSQTYGQIGIQAFEEVRSFLNSTYDNSGQRDLSLNRLLRDTFLDSDQALSATFEDLTFSEAGVTVSLKAFKLFGLDSFVSADVLDPIAPQTLRNKVSLAEIQVEVDLEIKLAEENVFRTLNDMPEKLKIAFKVQDLELDLSLFLAVSNAELGELALGSIFNTSEIFPCLLGSVDAVEATQLLVTAGDISVPTLTGFVSEEVGSILNQSMTVIFEAYKPRVQAALPAIFDQTLRPIVNGLIEVYREIEGQACLRNVPAFSPGFVDFRDLFLQPEGSVLFGGTGKNQYGDLFREIKGIIDDQVLTIDETDGTSGVNDLLIAPLTRSQSEVEGSLVFAGNLLDTNARVQVGGLDATVELMISNARIENLDTVVAPLAILVPLLGLANTLNNTASFGVADRPLTFRFTLLIGFRGNDDNVLRNELDIVLDVSAATAVFETMVKISDRSFARFPLRDIVNVDCWLASIPAPRLDERGVRVEGGMPTAALTGLLISLSKLSLNVTCISCTSPEMDDLSRMLSDPDAAEDVTRVANDVLDYVTTLLGGEFLQVQIDRILNEAPKRCPHRSEYQARPVTSVYQPFEEVQRDEDSITFLIAMVVAASVLLCSMLIVLVFVKVVVHRRNKAWVNALSAHEVMSLHAAQSEEKAKEEGLNHLSDSMFASEAIPLYVRLIVPVIIVGNIGFFLSGHLSLGATVNIEANLAGQGITVNNFFEFSMARSTIDIWNAGGRALAILILIFSGIWPYTKQLITLCLWFAPPSVVSVSRRGSIFLWLDALAKWSMVDIFVLVLSVAAFRVSVLSPDLSFLPDDFYRVDLFVVPLWGLYANMIAQLISQVSSHFIIHYHRRIVETASEQYKRSNGVEAAATILSDAGDSVADADDDADLLEDQQSRSDRRDVSLRDHGFVRAHRGEKDTLHVRPGVNIGLVSVAGLLFLLVIVGCSLPSLSLEVLGIIGVAIESGQNFEQAYVDYSVFTIVQLLIDVAKFLGSLGDYVGLGVLAVLFLSTVLIVPIVQSLVLLFQWFTPLSAKQMNRISILIETLQAWQYLEVYLLAIVVASWQLGPVSDFMINSYCDGLVGAFAALEYYGVLEPTDAQCFRVQAGIENATYILIVAAVLLALLNTFVKRAVSQRALEHSALHVTNIKSFNHSDDYEDHEVEAARESLQYVPVLFSDTFRWLLAREDSPPGDLDSDKLGVEDGFLESAHKGFGEKTVEFMVESASLNGSESELGILPADKTFS